MHTHFIYSHRYTFNKCPTELLTQSSPCIRSLTRVCVTVFETSARAARPRPGSIYVYYFIPYKLSRISSEHVYECQTFTVDADENWPNNIKAFTSQSFKTSLLLFVSATLIKILIIIIG